MNTVVLDWDGWYQYELMVSTDVQVDIEIDTGRVSAYVLSSGSAPWHPQSKEHTSCSDFGF